MTNEEFKQIYAPRLASKYMRERGKVSAAAAYQSMTPQQRDAVDSNFELSNVVKAANMIQHARSVIALSLAQARIDELIADGNISIADELDELR